MKLSREEVAKLSRLCAVQLTPEEESAFLMKLEGVIGLISRLTTVDIADSQETINLSSYHPMKTSSYDDPAGLLLSVKHPLKANMIEIKSPLAN